MIRDKLKDDILRLVRRKKRIKRSLVIREMIKKYGCDAATINRAINELIDEGKIRKLRDLNDTRTVVYAY